MPFACLRFPEGTTPLGSHRFSERSWILKLTAQCPLRSLADIDLRLPAQGVLVSSADGLGESLSGFLANQINRAPTEPCAGHAGAQNSRLFPGQLDQDIEFLGADLVIIPQALVGSVHELAESLQVTGFQNLDGLQNPVVLGNHVSGPSKQNFTEGRPHRLQVGGLEIAERFSPQAQRQQSAPPPGGID